MPAAMTMAIYPLVAGGGFKHGRHIHTDKTKDNLLLGDLYITLQQMGIETESFSNANRNFNDSCLIMKSLILNLLVIFSLIPLMHSQ